MSWPTVLCASIAATCLTLAAVHLVIWVKNPATRPNLAFGILAIGVACFTWANLAMMRAETPDAFAWALWWANGTIFVMVAGVVAFVRSYCSSSRAWLGHAAWILRLIAFGAHLVRMPRSDFEQISGLRFVNFLGERVAVAEGTVSVWFWVGQASLATLLWFVVDACYTLWRVGNPAERRRALVIGVPTAVFVLAGATSAALIFGRVVDWPHAEFLPFMGMLSVMGYELSSDVLRAAKLTGELQVSEAALRDSEQRMTMAAEAARLGMWIWDLRTGDTWLTTRCREMFAFPDDAAVTYDAFATRLHPGDRERIDAEARLAIETGSVHQAEYRVVLPDGSTRWIASHLRADLDASGRPYRLLGVCIDVSEQRSAERAARELGGRLINAQEDERRRIARDLHDDFNQRLSLISVELELLGRTQSSSTGGQVDQLAAQVRELSSEVHRLSYQLHPAKLDQLGLVTAARSWCRDVAEQSGVNVTFEAVGVPADVPADIALCFYRVLQEALRNVIRHSQARTARVELTMTDRGLQLVVSDTGKGFSVEAAIQPSGLGLVSMRERAHLLQGSLDVQSRPGGGTRVIVTVPLPVQATVASETAASTPDAGIGGVS